MLAGAGALLVLGLGACGDGGDSTSTTTAADTQGSQAEEKSAGADSNAKPKQGAKDVSDSASKKPSAKETQEASEFVPRQHTDSGGGSKQFKVKGGDNSVQEFGAEVEGSEQDEAATALHNFLDARGEGNWAAACSYMSKSIVESFESLASRSKELKGAGCGELLETLSNKDALPELRKEAERANVGSLRIEGDQAFIIYQGLEGSIMAMSMTQEDGAWKVGSLAATPLN